MQITSWGEVALDKRRLKALMRLAGTDIASKTRRLISQTTGSGRYYAGGGGSAYRGSYRAEGYYASAPGQPPVSVTGTLRGSLKVYPYESGNGFAVRERAFYALFLEAGARGGGNPFGGRGAIRGCLPPPAETPGPRPISNPGARGPAASRPRHCRTRTDARKAGAHRTRRGHDLAPNEEWLTARPGSFPRRSCSYARYCPLLGGRVAGAADFRLGLQRYNENLGRSAQPSTAILPTAFVIPLGAESDGPGAMTGIYQHVLRTIGIIVEFPATPDRRGQQPAMDTEAMEACINAAILNWEPVTCLTVGRQGYWLAGARFLDLDRARLFYQWEYALNTILTDLDAWQPSSVPLKGIELKIWQHAAARLPGDAADRSAAAEPHCRDRHRQRHGAAGRAVATIRRDLQ